MIHRFSHSQFLRKYLCNMFDLPLQVEKFTAKDKHNIIVQIAMKGAVGQCVVYGSVFGLQDW